MTKQTETLSELQNKYLQQVSQEVNIHLGALNYALTKFNSNAIANELRIKVAQAVLSGNSPRLSDLLEGTSIRGAAKTGDSECVLESEGVHTGTSSLDLLCLPGDSADLRLSHTSKISSDSTK